MRKLYKFLMLATTVICAQQTQAQDDISQLFKGSPADVNKLINAYTMPLFKGFGNSLNGGWTNTAQTLGTLRFGVRISVSGSFIPTSDKSFDVNSLGLANIKASNSSQSTAATFGGDKNLQTSIRYTDPNNSLATYTTNLPGGVIDVIPAPQVQLTVGLIKHTDVTLRFIPKIKAGDVGSVGMLGFGLKHNITEDLKAIPFDLAVGVGYTRLNYEKSLDVRPDANNGGVSGSQNFDNQSLEGHFNGFNAQLIISKKLLFFTPYASVGYATSTTDVALKGNFPFVTSATLTGRPIYTTYTDPISIKGTGTGISGMRADLGFQIGVPFFKLYASYSFADYNSANAGIGFGF